MAKVEAAYAERNQATDADFIYTQASLPYLVFDVADEDEAIAAVKAEVSTTFNDMVLSGVEISERMNDTTFKVNVNYKRETSGTLEYREAQIDYSFDTTGGTQHITQALLTYKKYFDEAYLPAAPDFGDAINVDENEVKGVDIVMPIHNFSETHYYRKDTVTTSFKINIADMTGKINKAPFRGFDINEVLFLGASGALNNASSSSAYWNVNYKFAVSRNTMDFKIGGMTIDFKFGWEYLWVLYQKVVDDAAYCVLKKPVAAYRQDVYKDGDFFKLGIGN